MYNFDFNNTPACEDRPDRQQQLEPAAVVERLAEVDWCLAAANKKSALMGLFTVLNEGSTEPSPVQKIRFTLSLLFFLLLTKL